MNMMFKQILYCTAIRQNLYGKLGLNSWNVYLSGVDVAFPRWRRCCRPLSLLAGRGRSRVDGGKRKLNPCGDTWYLSPEYETQNMWDQHMQVLVTKICIEKWNFNKIHVYPKMMFKCHPCGMQTDALLKFQNLWIISLDGLNFIGYPKVF